MDPCTLLLFVPQEGNTQPLHVQARKTEEHWPRSDKEAHEPSAPFNTLLPNRPDSPRIPMPKKDNPSQRMKNDFNDIILCIEEDQNEEIKVTLISSFSSGTSWFLTSKTSHTKKAIPPLHRKITCRNRLKHFQDPRDNTAHHCETQ